MIIPKEITRISRELRQNMTRSEKLLWKEVRSQKLGVKFLRQHPIHILTEDNNQARCIIVDFYCHAYKLIVEIDGGIHDIPEVMELDTEKENFLITQGYSVMRFTNEQIITDIKTVISQLQKYTTE